MPTGRLGRVYKELTVQQLRSFCETARLGSFTAAAAALGLAHPTVWQQVRALERHLASPLVEPHGRGCRLTEDGRLFAELAAPMVAGIDSLKRNFEEKRGRIRPRLTVATTQRTLIEDLPTSILEFEKRYPEVLLCFKEMSTRDVAIAVEAGTADFGITAEREPEPPNPRLVFEPAFELEHFLVTPKNHPLARRKRIRPRDLLPYPLVNAADSIPDPAVSAALEKLGVFRTPPRRIEAYYTAVIRHYVALGFGIGLVVGLPTRRPQADLHERSLSRYFGRTIVSLVRRKGVPTQSFSEAFADLIRERLGRRHVRLGKKARSASPT